MTLPRGLTAADLAPGDGKSLGFDASRVTFHPIERADDPWFQKGYDLLWREFGHRHEMEQREVILRRLQWDPAVMDSGYALLYRMVVAEAEQRIAAVRDHCVILCPGPDDPLVVVHLAHVWVDPAWRRSGLAGWMRALPIVTAREALGRAGMATDTPIILVAEMEHAQPGNAEQSVRLKAYGRAGFRRADPDRIPYHQPDFRTPEEIDRSGGPHPIPMVLLLRAVGFASDWKPDAAMIRRIVGALYHMYGLGFRARDMRAAHETLQEYPSGNTPVALLPPLPEGTAPP